MSKFFGFVEDREGSESEAVGLSSYLSFFCWCYGGCLLQVDIIIDIILNQDGELNTKDVWEERDEDPYARIRCSRKNNHFI